MTHGGGPPRIAKYPEQPEHLMTSVFLNAKNAPEAGTQHFLADYTGLT